MKTRIVLVILAFFLAGTVMAKYKGKYADWIDGPVSHLMTKKEKKEFKKLKSDKDAEEFIKLFWAKRDPTPETPRNEYKERFDSRVAKADVEFENPVIRGAMTDRGKIFIVFGPPSAAKASVYQGGAGSREGLNITSEGSGGGEYGKKFIHGTVELWAYRKDRLPECVQQHEVTFKFLKEEKAKYYTMNRQHGPVLQALAHAVECAIVNPDLKEVPEHARLLTSGPSAMMKTTERLFSGETFPAKSEGFLEIAPFFTQGGEAFIAVQLYFPEKNWHGQSDQQQFALVLKNQAGEYVAKADEPVVMKSTKGGVYVDRSILVTPGNYDLALSLGPADGEPVYSKLYMLNVPEITDEGYQDLWFTLAMVVKPLDKPQYATDPFTFGGAKVVPKSDNVFEMGKEMWWLINVVHPGLDEAGNPRMTCKLVITREGKPIKGYAPSDLSLTKLHDGCYMTGASFILGQDLELEPGEYTFTMTFEDKISGKKWEKVREITVIE